MNQGNISPIYQREGDPLIYLQVKGQWYYYDPTSKPLGEGAMGIVYLGYNNSSNQRIAVKYIRPAFANNTLIRQRAKQEASLSFSHPNIVQMIGLCEYPEGKGPMFVLSSYISGVTLEYHVKNQLAALSQSDRVEKISREICSVLDALNYLHSRGVVHRDIKPSNLMLENGTTVKLMDLGIARMNGGNKFSSYGFIGTPQYAAPEQIFRDTIGAEINASTDLYSLGITFYEFLTGVNPMNSNVDSETLSNQVTKKLPYNKVIPNRLFKVISKATEKDSTKRYQTAIEFKEAILDAISRPDCPKLQIWIEDHKLIAAIVAIMTILTILLTTIALIR